MLKRMIQKLSTPKQKKSLDTTGRIMPKANLEKQWEELKRNGMTNMSCEDFIQTNTQLHGWTLI